ncbi:transcription termination factor MTEF18, mitochondrial-like isoform X3 [Prunus avium]|uniref:Transcription termination factor MTEF18, mitochondrial-like isoform X3 n=1 Tax=Prunus avium TaxID=42229 RepID=A0A6P5RIR5_PRUAV|nr:transcription termination factor MTEF18, mitochondrial-like isoform X3 [Prunus avium]XP_021800711.1 transcription termination factor MTEF18, mitochondrial-like isoform X3 [Prunus avium]XP_021830655.1 transcription termination factor MTEF18, mitochondrial-like isoform X3 [Prunus avium]
MTHLQKLRVASILKWVSLNFYENHLRSSTTPFQPIGSFSNAQSPRLYRTKRASEDKDSENVDKPSTGNEKNAGQISSSIKKEAQAALLDYLHGTRGVQFMDAENMSKNSPHFLDKLLKQVDSEKEILMKKNNEKEIGREISRFLRYHPINEFEPFFESLGLKPSEYFPLLPRSLMFLTDDQLLVHNYTVLCHYGIARNKIGKIYKEATEVFQYDFEVLLSKLKAYEKLGLSQPTLIKFFVASPYLLIGDVNVEFVKALENLKSIGFETNWIEGNLSADSSYNWSQMLEVLRLFSEMGCSNEHLGELIGQHPYILFEGSGGNTISLIGLLLKFGSTKSQLCSMFLQFPPIPVVKFVSNLRQCILFLNEIEMKVSEIGKIVHSHPLLLGSISLKKANSLLNTLKTGKTRLCRYIQENPQELKNWVLGKRVDPFPGSGENRISKTQKTKFLLDIGFVDNSNKMKKALRGKGGELQERFDCIVKAGLSQEDVCEMIKAR